MSISQKASEKLESDEVLRELYWERGLSLNEIADELEVSQTTVYRRMKEHDIPRRPDGGWWQEGERVTKKCERCGKEFRVKPYREETARFCSRECHNAHQKEGNIKKECEECGKEFEVPPSQKDQRFCSKSCYLENLNEGGERVELECDQCGKKFQRKPSAVNEKRNYCSRECAQEAGFQPPGPEKERKTVNCDYCGKEIERLESALGEINFCSPKCVVRYFGERRTRDPENYETKTCPVCGEEFESLKSKEREYCSIECAREGRKNRETVVCENCGKEFEKIKSKVKEENFCSQECWKEYEEKKLVKLKCDTCGREFERPQSQVNEKGKNFCSRECAFTTLSENSKLRDRSWLYERYWIDLMSTNQIKEMIPEGGHTVWAYLKFHGIETRSQKDAVQLSVAKRKGECKGKGIDEILADYSDFHPEKRRETNYERMERILKEA
ncbi:hypothetical protein AKJ38_01205 [candidate division MSBL1 archaeon SCGC-AAA259I14]|uniref:TRASH domain-containing protein n=1 Tax=candidate division MSBL1 archaeon SCGC-AAA259I14 TaxID=1698268 RepID=A0A133UT82_9EURY|nr:hypothetical protein AKJ38_01205 [candidate division MSBL1 archaeon SCGC-AAA259I14]